MGYPPGVAQTNVLPGQNPPIFGAKQMKSLFTAFSFLFLFAVACGTPAEEATTPAEPAADAPAAVEGGDEAAPAADAAPADAAPAAAATECKCEDGSADCDACKDAPAADAAPAAGGDEAAAKPGDEAAAKPGEEAAPAADPATAAPAKKSGY